MTSRRSTTSSAAPATPGTSTTSPGARRAVRPRPWPPGFTSFEVGTDIGGSVRIPSHCCGVFGLKPSFGVVPAARLPRPRRRRHDRRRHQRVRSDRAQRRRPRSPRSTCSRHPRRSSRPRGASNCRRARRDRSTSSGSASGSTTPSVRSAPSTAPCSAPPPTRSPTPGPSSTRDTRRSTSANRRPCSSTWSGRRCPSSAPDEAAEVMAGSHRSWLRAEEQRAALQACGRSGSSSTTCSSARCSTVPPFPHVREGDIMERTVEVDGESRAVGSLIAWLGLIGVMGLPSAVVADRPHRRRPPRRHADRVALPARPPSGAGGEAGRRGARRLPGATRVLICAH